jgi:hypothetical protein
MTFGSQYSVACLSTISAPFRAYAPISTANANSTSLVYEYTEGVWSNGVGGNVVRSSIITITTGLAVADPIVIAWQMNDLTSFPPDYATSLAKRIGVAVPTNTATPSPISSTIPPTAHNLSTGAKAGIGIGTTIGTIITLSILILYLRLRRTKAPNISSPSEPKETIAEIGGQYVNEMGEQDHCERKSYLGGRWRSEAPVEDVQHELDARAVNVVPGSPVKLDAAEVRD